MADQPISLPIDYVTKDYEGFYQLAKDNIPILLPEWTNIVQSDPGIAILQQLSYGLQILAYQESRATAENLLPIARTRKAILMLAQFLGYTPHAQKPSSVTLKFTKETTQVANVIVISERTLVATDPALGNQVYFETDEALTIPAMELEGFVTATQGRSIYDEILGVGDNTAGQEFTTTYADVLSGFIFKTVENGVRYIWTLVDSFIDSIPNDRHYMISVRDDGRMTVTVGNGTSGMRVPVTAIAYIDYRYGGGLRGNVGVNKITSIEDVRVTGIASVTNEAAATGGTDSESLERIKLMAPKAYRTAGRAVTASDFEDIAEQIAGVAKAKCVETFNVDNEIELYIATTGGTNASTELKNEISETIESVMVMNQVLLVLDATYIEVDITSSITLKDDAVSDDVEAAIELVLTNTINTQNFSFGDDLDLGRLWQIIYNAHEGIKKVTFSGMTDTECTDTQIVVLGAINLTMIGGV